MTTLLYCIVANMGIITNNEGASILHGETGLEGHPLHVVTHNGHGAVCSDLSVSSPPMTVEGIYAFNAVIQHLADQTPTIPMRYGCIFEDHRGIGEYLARHHNRNDALLQRVHGCVEMSIRIARAGLPTTADAAGERAKYGTAPASGRSYLDLRRKCYAAREKNKAAIEAVVSSHLQPFEGLYREVRRQVPSPGGGPPPLAHQGPGPSNGLYLHFLVQRSMLETFMAAFDGIRQSCAPNVSISGPWPPYNFVMDKGRDLPGGT